MRGSTLTGINWRVQTPGKECRKKWCVKKYRRNNSQRNAQNLLFQKEKTH